jgi:coenzyme PQQ synthesis protein D (PqqD)
MLDTMTTAVREQLRMLEVAKPDCVADDFGGEVVVLNLTSGVYFSLRDLAAAVWRDLAAGNSVESIITGIRRVDERIAEATVTLIDSFERAGLMRGSLLPAKTSESPASIALIRMGETRLTIESFEDMKDLILSDPIHDSDDQLGWPALPHTGAT